MSAALFASAVLAASLTAGAQPPGGIEAAQRALAGGDPARAAELFALATESDAANCTAWRGLAAALETSRPIDALPAARRAVECDPGSAPAALALGRLLARAGAVAAALPAFERARALGAREVEAWVAPALILRDSDRAQDAIALLETAPQPSREAAEALALLLLAAGQPARARSVAAAALVSSGDSPTLLFARGMAAAVAGERESAIADLSASLALGAPDPGRAQLELASLLGEVGRHEEAEGAFDAAARALPLEPEVPFRRAGWLRARGLASPARAALEQHQALLAQRSALAERARAFERAIQDAGRAASENRLDQALELLAPVLAEHPVDPRASALEAKVLYSLNRREEALRALERALLRAPGVVEYSYLHAVFLRGAGRRRDAEDAARRALALDPDLPQGWGLLAVLTADGGRWEESAVHYQRALELGLDTRALRLGYAAVLERLGRGEDAARQRAAAPP